MRTKEGMAIARAKGKLKGKKPKLSDRRQSELRRMYDTGEYSISDLAELFDVSRPTVYRVLQRTLGADTNEITKTVISGQRIDRDHIRPLERSGFNFQCAEGTNIVSGFQGPASGFPLACAVGADFSDWSGINRVSDTAGRYPRDVPGSALWIAVAATAAWPIAWAI